MTTQLGASIWRGPTLDAWSRRSSGARWSALGVLHWEHGLLYLDRYHEQETQVLDDLTSREPRRPRRHRPRAAGRLAGAGLRGRRWRRTARRLPRRRQPVDDRDHRRTRHRQDHRGRRAAGAAARAGRGARRAELRIAMAAPTGKAAARLEQAVREPPALTAGGPARLAEAAR